MFSFIQQQIINSDIESVFSFFKQPENLSKTTPRWLNFEIITPLPLIMKEGAEFEYTIRLYKIKMHWKTLISEYRPLEYFIDEKVNGPYKKWIHKHSFEIIDDGVLMLDYVQYDLYGGPLKYLINKLFVQRSIKQIFRYRKEIFEKEFL